MGVGDGRIENRVYSRRRRVFPAQARIVIMTPFCEART